MRIEQADDPRLIPFTDVREKDLVGRDHYCILEGVRVLEIALTQDRLPLHSVLISDAKALGLADLIAHLETRAPVFIVEQSVMDRIVGFPIHRGVLALAQKPTAPHLGDLLQGLPDNALVVAAIGLSNHDNVGALFRNAAAFGVDALAFDKTCADPFYRKAIRVSLGHVLRLPFGVVEDDHAVIDALETAEFDVLALSPAGDRPVRALSNQTRFGRRTALLLGPEGPGLSDAALARTETVSIPMAAGVDSLNVATAAAVALSHLRR